MDLYFIDDGSKDNTVSYINKLKNKKRILKFILIKENKDWELVGRIKMVYFLRIKKYDLAITMDTDLAHNPKYFSKLLNLIKIMI